MARPNEIYLSLIDITADYLGPAAHRFIDRQIESHLGKEPQSITAKDLEHLVDWIMVALALLTDNQKIRSEYAKRLAALLSSRGGSRD